TGPRCPSLWPGPPRRTAGANRRFATHPATVTSRRLRDISDAPAASSAMRNRPLHGRASPRTLRPARRLCCRRCVHAMFIRNFDPVADRAFLRSCVIELQAVERRFDARLPAGEQIVDAYCDLLLERCRSWDGTILVADDAGTPVG